MTTTAMTTTAPLPASTLSSNADARRHMAAALAAGATVRTRTSPNPWVGCVIVTTDGEVFGGATEPPGQRHAERVALDAAISAGASTQGATVFVTLEPCDHHGRTAPCTAALIDAGVATVVVALTDPDVRVSGKGIATLQRAGIDVVAADPDDQAAASDLLAPYLHHRRTGRPFVVLKLAATLDGQTAAADGTSKWITGPAARAAAHQLRAESDAIVVGAGTVRADNPSLTTRLVDGPSPRRIVLGSAPANAAVHPCTEHHGPLGALLDTLGAEGVLQVLIEGGATVAAAAHREHLVDRYVIYVAPALMGGDDGTPLLAGPGAASINDLWRGRIVSVRQLGDDIEIVVDRPTPLPPEGSSQ